MGQKSPPKIILPRPKRFFKRQIAKPQSGESNAGRKWTLLNARFDSRSLAFFNRSKNSEAPKRRDECKPQMKGRKARNARAGTRVELRALVLFNNDKRNQEFKISRNPQIAYLKIFFSN